MQTLPNEPLNIIITESASEVLLLRSLLRHALDMVQRPANYTDLQKMIFATAIETALHGSDNDEE